MRELNIYRIAVNLHGPHALSKSGSGMWFVCETSEKNAKKALQKHFSENHLLGSSDDIDCAKYLYLDTEILPRGACMERDDYKAALKEKKESQKNQYQFSPKKSEKGIALHKPNREPQNYREVIVPGAEKTPDTLQTISDCGDLPDIDGITYNGQALSANNLDNMIEELSLEV